MLTIGADRSQQLSTGAAARQMTRRFMSEITSSGLILPSRVEVRIGIDEDMS